MIQASFDQAGRTAAISGATQYDTGQRIRMYGLPAPEELSDMDDFLSGDVVTVQAQYAYAGDSQSEPRLCTYDEQEACWVAEVPDQYLTRSEAVSVYVYVSYGEDETHGRSKTMYTGRFTPISRSAPSNNVTPDQKNAWDALVGEVNLALATIGTATSGANAAAAGASEAAQRAQSAAQAAAAASAAADKMTASWANATAEVTTLAPGSEATVALGENADGAKKLSFGVPKGEKGDKGDTGPAGVTFTLSGTTLYITTD